MYGLWWREDKDDISLVSVVLSKRIREIIIKDHNDKILERKVLYGKANQSTKFGKVVYSFHLKIPLTTRYITVTSNNLTVLLVKGEGSPNYEMRSELGMKLGDWLEKIGEIYISVAGATIRQIDGILYNI